MHRDPKDLDKDEAPLLMPEEDAANRQSKKAPARDRKQKPDPRLPESNPRSTDLPSK